MTAPLLARVGQVLADPRQPSALLAAPGAAGELLGLLRGTSALLADADAMIAGTHEEVDWLITEVERLCAQVDTLSNDAAKVLTLHVNSVDDSCSSCRVPHPCDTARVVLERRRP